MLKLTIFEYDLKMFFFPVPDGSYSFPLLIRADSSQKLIIRFNVSYLRAKIYLL